MNENIDESVLSLSKLLKDVLSNKILKAEFNWNISDKTISEIGGRLIEDYVLCELPNYIKMNKGKEGFEFLNCIVPESQRSMEDIEFVWKYNDIVYHLLVDIKGHNDLKSGSRPNLASIRKCREFYPDKTKSENNELYIFFCRYKPNITKQEGITKIEYSILEDSFNQKGIFPLKFLHEKNMDPANIGSGGQILLARENEIELVKRSNEDFVKQLDRFSAYLKELKSLKEKEIKSSKKNKIFKKK